METFYNKKNKILFSPLLLPILLFFFLILTCYGIDRKNEKRFKEEIKVAIPIVEEAFNNEEDPTLLISFPLEYLCLSGCQGILLTEGKKYYSLTYLVRPLLSIDSLVYYGSYLL